MLHYRTSLNVVSKSIGENALYTGFALQCVGKMYREMYNFDSALIYLEKSLQVISQYEKKHGFLMTVKMSIANALVTSGQTELGLKHHQDIMREKLDFSRKISQYF